MPWGYAGLLMTTLAFTKLDKNYEGGKGIEYLLWEVGNQQSNKVCPNMAS